MPLNKAQLQHAITAAIGRFKDINPYPMMAAEEAVQLGWDLSKLERVSPNSDWYYKPKDAGPFQSYFGDEIVTYKRKRNLQPARYLWSESPAILGVNPDFVIIDDPLNQGAKKVATKPVKKAYNTVGVRFLDGSNLAKVYTYRVAKKARLHLGQEVIVPTDKNGTGFISPSIGVVVELHAKPQDDGPYDYKFVRGTIKPL